MKQNRGKQNHHIRDLQIPSNLSNCWQFGPGKCWQFERQKSRPVWNCWEFGNSQQFVWNCQQFKLLAIWQIAENLSIRQVKLLTILPRRGPEHMRTRLPRHECRYTCHARGPERSGAHVCPPTTSRMNVHVRPLPNCWHFGNCWESTRTQIAELKKVSNLDKLLGIWRSLFWRTIVYGSPTAMLSLLITA